MNRLRYAILLLFLLTAFPLFAQDNTCSAVLEQAISSVQDDCNATGRNQACYGNVLLNATPREGVQDFEFANRGDLVNVVDVDTLRLSALNAEEETWGVALMQLQANLPDTLPGQNVTFLLFGDVEIQNAVPAGEQLATVEITANNGINVRGGPSTNAAVIGSLTSGETAVANGRNADSSWLRIQLPDSDALGWVFADLVTPASGFGPLSVVDAADSSVPYTPMQAFRFSSGIGQTTCADAPQDGILIQTPQGVGKIELRVNDVDVQLGSTAYFRAQPDAKMTISLVEGEGRASANGKSVIVPAGARVEIPLDANLSASDVPADPVPYDLDTVRVLPVEGLPRPITIAPPATEEEIQAANQPASGASARFPGGSIPGVDMSAFAGMDASSICPFIDQALAEAGMSREEYLGMLQQVMGMVPADQQQAFTQIEQLIMGCS